MSKKRGLTVDEKRQRLQELYLEKVSVFSLKELEKVAAKEKGIGSFASQALNVRNQQLGKLRAALDAAKEQLSELEGQERQLKKVRVEGADRESMDAQINELEATLARQTAELKTYAELDPDTLKAIKEDGDTALEAVNRWTDAVFSLESYIKNKFPSVEISAFKKSYNIPEELDYLS